MKELNSEHVALVTGATGVTGRELVRQLAARGVAINAIARSGSDLSGLEHLPVHWIRGNVYDAGVIDCAVRDVDVIFHLAACYRDAGAADQEYRNVHVVSSQLLAQAAVRQPSVPKIVHVSTMGVHGHIEHPPGNEDSPFAPGDIYQETKLEAEQWMRRFCAENGVPLLVVRPTAIAGPEDARLLKLHKFAKRGLFPLLGGHDTLYHLVHVEDLARFLIHCATHSRDDGAAFLCGNATYTSVREILATLAEHYGNRMRFVNVPSAPVYWLADVCESVCKPMGISPPLYRRRVAFFSKDRAFDTSRSRDDLGFRYGYDNRRTLLETADAYLAKGWV